MTNPSATEGVEVSSLEIGEAVSMDNGHERGDVEGDPELDIEAQTTAAAAVGASLIEPSSKKNTSARSRKAFSQRNVFTSRRNVYQKAQSATIAPDNKPDDKEEQPHDQQQQTILHPEHSSTPRECHVQVVTGLRDAMDPKLRRRKEFGKRNVEDLYLDETNAQLGPDTQYRLTSTGGYIREQASYDPTNTGFFNQLGFNAYVHWSYKANFVSVFLSLTVVFYFLVTLFAVFLYIVGIAQPECLYVGSLDIDFQQAGNYFGDVFAISWTTFSTVVRGGK
ncbi:MAG: hypothetical protein SGARI_001030 [Bacillariaceae sp.]